MVKITPDQALIASRKNEESVNTTFVNRVMNNLAAKNKINSFLATLMHMPRFALAGLAIAALLLVSGTAYAAYHLWFSPIAKVQQLSPNQHGRQEALVAFQNCKNTAGATYEVKSGQSLTAKQIGQLLQARCEMDTITDWANKKWPFSPEANTHIYPGAFKVAAIQDRTVTLHGSQDSPTVTLTNETILVIDGSLAPINTLKIGDSVATVEWLTYNPEGGSPTSRTLLALVALKMPSEFYEPNMQNRVAERTPCHGNPAESCVNNGGIDVYLRNGENNMEPATPGDPYEIQGRIIEHNGNTIRIKASSGAIYTITAPSDIIAQFNQNQSIHYQGMQITSGDMLHVRYSQKSTDDHKNVQPQQLFMVNLMIELVKKTDGLKKY